VVVLSFKTITNHNLWEPFYAYTRFVLLVIVLKTEQITLLVDNRTKRAVSDKNNIKKATFWSSKQRRAYHRIMSGYKFTQYMGGHLRFMTLTTSNDGRSHDLKQDFNTLVKRIRRRYGLFEYVRVRTSEGNGVLHVLFRGCYIPHRWLQEQWEDIHVSWNVDIRDTRRYHCSYVVNQYLCGQSSFIRYSMTQSWVEHGFVSVWEAFRKWYYDDRFILWDDWLHAHARAYTQQMLCDFG